jgi:cytochrome c-type biogenesis protein CcmH/NrfF
MNVEPSRRNAFEGVRSTLVCAAFAALVSLVLLIANPGVAWAEAPPSHGAEAEGSDVSPEVAQKAASIARQTMSPFCPGRTLSDCPSEYAAEWRRDIRTMVAEGLSASEIQARLEARVDGNLSGIPNRDASYALPMGLAAAAALLLFFVFMRLRGRKEEPPKGGGRERTPSTPATVDDQRLNEELDSED